MKILVVDDDLHNRQLVGFVLEEAEHTCHFAEDGEMAVALWREVKPDLILMDVMMPVLDGYEAAKRIKQETGQDHVPIVFLTALSEDKALARCLDVGDDFLGKPINFVMLQAKIRAHSRTLALNRQVVEQNQELNYFHAKVQAEHEMTQHIMKAALKSGESDIPGFRAICTAASAFNGDLVLMHQKKDGGAFFLIGDFTGHGLAASVGSMPVSQAFRTMSGRNLAVSEISRELNRVLNHFLPPTMFFACVIGEINMARNRMDIWYGGLPDAFVIDPQGKIRRSIGSAHMPLGILDDDEFEANVEVISLDCRDRIFLYTDGITECPNQAGDMFGEDRLKQVLAHGGADILDAVIDAIHQFNDDPELQDDISLIEIDCQVPGVATMEESTTEETSIIGASMLPKFQIDFEWGPRQLRESDPLMLLRQWFGTHASLRANKEIVFMVLAELFNNALEHGVLELSSDLKQGDDGFDAYYQERSKRLAQLQEGFVKLQVGLVYEHQTRLTLRVSDSGKGFTPGRQQLDDSDDCFGRGLPLLQALCKELLFSSDDSSVVAVMELSD